MRSFLNQPCRKLQKNKLSLYWVIKKEKDLMQNIFLLANQKDNAIGKKELINNNDNNNKNNLKKIKKRPSR